MSGQPFLFAIARRSLSWLIPVLHRRAGAQAGVIPAPDCGCFLACLPAHRPLGHMIIYRKAWSQSPRGQVKAPSPP